MENIKLYRTIILSWYNYIMKKVLKFLIGVYIFIGLILVVVTFPPESLPEVFMTIFAWPYYVLQGFGAASLL